MQLAATILLLALAAPAETPAGPSAPAAAKAAVTIQVLSAKPGDGSTGEGVDPRLAAKLRVSLEQMGIRRPDISSLSKPKTSELAPGESAVAVSGGAGVEATCKAVGEDGVTLSVALFAEVREGKKTVRRFSDPTTVTFGKPGQVQPFVQGDGKTMRIYVVGAVREGGGEGEKGAK